ncbi:MAG: hypothetical protein HQK98_06500 [Nitrospirae bacterium]|nr:hypothetical protein [Nitrospirota bacterium]
MTANNTRTIIFVLICLVIIFCIKKFKSQDEPENSENANNTLYDEIAKLAGSPKYIGELKDGLPNGHGTVIYANGTTLTGQFKDGIYIGR